MKKIVVAACALAMLSGCGERGASSTTGDKPAADAAQVNAEIEDSHRTANEEIDRAREERADAATEEGSGRRVQAYKRSLLALVAGDYAGDCTSKSGDVEQGEIVVESNGQVSASGMKPRNLMDEDSTLSLSSELVGGKAVRMRFAGGGDQEGWKISSVGRDEVTTIVSDKRGAIKCIDDVPASAGRDGTLYQALSRYFIAGAKTMQCADGSGDARDTRIDATDGGIAIGNNSFALVRDDAAETVTVDARGATLSYNHEAPSGEKVAIKLDRGGVINFLEVRGNRGSKVFSCTRERAARRS